MEIRILKDEKDDFDVELENVTLAEVLKVYLNQDPSVEFAAWKRIHPTENPILSLKTKGKTAKITASSVKNKGDGAPKT